MKILRQKIANMKDLFIFNNSEYNNYTRNFEKAEYSSNKVTANLTSIIENKTKDRNETKYYKYNIDEDELSKVKTDNLILKQKLSEMEKNLNTLKKENTLLINSDKNDSNLKYLILSILSKNFNFREQSEILKSIFDQNKIPIMNLLLDRIETLELQNFHLITKNDNLTQMIKGYIDELIEYYDVVCDIRNVLNQVYEAQTITREFVIIRETLNNKNEFLKKQKEIFLEEKNQLNNNYTKETNIDILLCKNKIDEFKINKISNILDEKIDYYENLKSDNQDSRNINRECLVHENHLLRMNNLKLRNMIEDLITKHKINLSEETVKRINNLINNCFDFIVAEDLFYMLNSQAQLIENIINN